MGASSQEGIEHVVKKKKEAQRNKLGERIEVRKRETKL